MTNKMQLFWFIYLYPISSTCFGRCFRPSSGSLECIYSFWYCPPILLQAGVMDEVELLPAMASSFFSFLDHTKRRATDGGTPLDEWSARRRDFCLTTHNTHNRHTSMSPVEFEPTISAGEWPQTYALGRAATGIGVDLYTIYMLCSV